MRSSEIIHNGQKLDLDHHGYSGVLTFARNADGIAMILIEKSPNQVIKSEIYLGNPTGPLAEKKLQLNQASVITTDWGKLVHGEPVIFCCCGISR